MKKLDLPELNLLEPIKYDPPKKSKITRFLEVVFSVIFIREVIIISKNSGITPLGKDKNGVMRYSVDGTPSEYAKHYKRLKKQTRIY